MTLAAIWSEASRSHDPAGEVWIGVPIEGDETPERGTVMKRAIDGLGLDVIEPHPHGDRAITAIHDPGMLEYLRTAYDEWVAAGYPDDPGQDRVVAYAFRHPGAFGHVAERLPRSRTAMAGVYCMDTCTVLGPGSYTGIRYAVDAALTAADLILAGEGHAYAAVRPPGHHAGTDYFGGSCYLNNAAIAAHHLVGAVVAVSASSISMPTTETGPNRSSTNATTCSTRRCTSTPAKDGFPIGADSPTRSVWGRG